MKLSFKAVLITLGSEAMDRMLGIEAECKFI